MKEILNKIRNIRAGEFAAKCLVIIKQAGSLAVRIVAMIQSLYRKFSETKIFRVSVRAILVIFILAAVVQFAVGILLYGFRDKAYAENSPFKPLYRAGDSNVVGRIIETLPFPIAVVNYDVITYQDFVSERSYIRHFYSSTKQEGVNLKEIDRQIVEQLIENKLVEQKALQKRIKVDSEDLKATMDLLSEQNGGRDKVEKILSDLYGLSFNEFQGLVKSQLLRDKLNEKVIARVDARHILIRVDADAAQDKIDLAKARIDVVLAEVKAGLDFSEAAKKYSEDIGSAEQGGKLEPFAMGEMVDEFSKAAFETKVDEIAGPIKTEFGWHIIKVDGRTGSVEKKFFDWLNEAKESGLILRIHEI